MLSAAQTLRVASLPRPSQRSADTLGKVLLRLASSSRPAPVTLFRRSLHNSHISVHRRHEPISRRCFSHQSEPVQTFPDPDRPDLFYHLFSSPDPLYALSFLPDPPPLSSAAVIGWLPASGQGENAGLNDFKENAHFREILHEAVQSALRDGVDEVQQNAAIQTGEGWMHIHDMRNVPALGRIGDPDDIIASVRVEEGRILADTYQPMPSYRLCTSDGVVHLTEGLAARLVQLMQLRVHNERRSGH